jgi:gamma-glutamyltranspeptidase/glutathione hydrolase
MRHLNDDQVVGRPVLAALDPQHMAGFTVAGAVGGWAEALAVAQPWGGALPISRLLAVAIHHARQGVPVTRSQVALTAGKWAECQAVEGYAETFAPRGLPALGEVIANPRLGATLEQLARAGLDDFYRGELARSLAADLERAGSPLRLADLEGWRARQVAPLSVPLSVGRIYNQPPPTQGVASLAILGIFDRLGVRQAESFEHLHGLVEATKRAFLWRNARVGDPQAMAERGDDPAAFLADASLAAQAARWAPIDHDGELHDRASYRHCWTVVQRAHVAQMELGPAVQRAFF